MSACRPKTQVSAWESSSSVVSTTRSVGSRVTLDTLRCVSRSSLVDLMVAKARVKSKSRSSRAKSGSGRSQLFSLLREEGWRPATAGLSRFLPHLPLDEWDAVSSASSMSLMSVLSCERSRFLVIGLLEEAAATERAGHWGPVPGSLLPFLKVQSFCFCRAVSLLYSSEEYSLSTT